MKVKGKGTQYHLQTKKTRALNMVEQVGFRVPNPYDPCHVLPTFGYFNGKLVGK